MRLSIVTTLYRSAPYVREFYARAAAAAQRIADDYEIIFVNDGSPDDSLDVAVALHASDTRVKVVDLSRNFGHHRAILAGLEHAQGELVYLLNVDLEERPEDLELFHRALQEHPDCDVAYGVRAQPKGSAWTRLGSRAFHFALRCLANDVVDRQSVLSRLMTQRYVQNLLRYREREVFLPGLFQAAGFKQQPVPVGSHFKGRSSYTFRRRVSHAVTGITSFSDRPLIYLAYLGLLMAAASGAVIVDLVLRKLLYGIAIQGWTSLIVSIWFVGGLLMLGQGVLGVYLSKVFLEVKGRPSAIVRRLYDRPAVDRLADQE